MPSDPQTTKQKGMNNPTGATLGDPRAYDPACVQTTITTNIVKFTEGDPRIENLMQALEDVIYERGQGLQFATIIGTIDLLKIQLLDNQKEAS